MIESKSINLVLIIGVAGFVYLQGEAQKQWILNVLEETYYSNHGVPTVDFTVDGAQDIGDGFLLSDAAQEEHLTGVKFKGRIANTRSTAISAATFMLLVAGQEKEFTISRISPANSTAFEVYVPDLEPAFAKEGRIASVSRMVHFRKD
jgi:hypothetical protein